MKIVDANVLLYAVNADADHHATSRGWLDAALGGADTVGLSWLVLLAFLRLVTSPKVFSRPLAPGDALAQLDDWIAAPGARMVHPTAAHSRILGDLLEQAGTAGNLVNDAHLAALAIEQRASVVSYDRDFARFTGLRWARPDDLLAG